MLTSVCGKYGRGGDVWGRGDSRIARKAFPWGKVAERQRGRMRECHCARVARRLPRRFAPRNDRFILGIATPVCGLVRNDRCGYVVRLVGTGVLDGPLCDAAARSER